MRILVDQNLSPTLVDQLTSAGHDAEHTVTIGMARASDPAIFEWCRSNGAVLVTADKKLTKFLAAERPADPTVVIVRGYFLDVDRLASDLLHGLPLIEGDGHLAWAGSVLVQSEPPDPRPAVASDFRGVTPTSRTDAGAGRGTPVRFEASR